MAACIAGKYAAEAEEFGLELGNLFQLTDDILDASGESGKLGKTVGKDEAEQKLTAVKVYTLAGARERAEVCAARCKTILAAMKDADTAFLYGIVDYVLKRDR